VNQRKVASLVGIASLGIALLSGSAIAQQTASAHHKYFLRSVWTAEALKDLQKRTATGNVAGVVKFDESIGCKLESWYFDYSESVESVNYGIVDCPDDISIAILATAVNTTGTVHVTVRPVLSAEDMDKVLAKSVAARPPQQQ
jgi:uncharacterized protein with GYD domain